MSTKIVFAVVVTFKRRQLLEQVVDRLLNQSYALSKIIIVDNNSQDGTEDLIKLKQENCNTTICAIEYHNTLANLGGAGGFEFGFRAADSSDEAYDFLWLMDDDLLPASDCLEKLVNTASTPEPHADIVQPLRINLDGSYAELSPVVYDLASPWLINPKRQSVLQKMQVDECTQSFEIAGIPFEGPLISAALIRKIGYPNPKFFIFNDDLDFALRARKTGSIIVCEPAAKATRLLLNNQVNDLNSWKGYFMLRNHFYILRNYGDNIFVRHKPFVMALFFCILHFFKGNLHLVKICFRALMDSKNLANNETYKP